MPWWQGPTFMDAFSIKTQISDVFWYIYFQCKIKDENLKLQLHWSEVVITIVAAENQ